MSEKKLLLKAAEINAMQGEIKIHYLNANAVRVNKSLGDIVGMKNIGVHLISVEPGKDSTEYHMHHCEEEFIYVISGKGLAIINRQTFEISAGDFLGFPAGRAAHNISNNGDTALVCLVAGQRSSYDICDYPDRQKRLYKNDGMRNLVEFSHIESNQK